MSTKFPKPIIVPTSVTIKSSQNTLVLSTSTQESTLKTAVLNLEVDQLHVNGYTADVGQVVMQGTTGPYWGTVEVPSGSVSTITSLTNVSSIDGSGLTIGSAGVALGNTAYTTNLKGNVVLNGSAGSAGQFILSNGTKAIWSTVQPTLSAILSFGNNAGNQSINECSSIDASFVLAVGQTTPQTVIGSSTGFTNIQGVLKINGNAGTSGQVLTSSGGSNPLWTDLDTNVDALGTVLKTGANAEQVGIYNLPSVDASNEALTLGGQSASSVELGSIGRTVNIVGNLNVASTAPANGALFVGNGTTASFETSVPTETLEFYSNSSYIALDNSTNCVKVGILDGQSNCAVHNNYISMMDLSSNEHSMEWDNNQGVLSLIPQVTGQLHNQWQSIDGSNSLVNLCGYASSYIKTTHTDTYVTQPDHSTMNNNYVLWLAPPLPGDFYFSDQRTLILKPITSEYKNMRFTLRNDSSVSFVILSVDTIYGCTILNSDYIILNDKAMHFVAVESSPGIYGWLVT